MGTGVIVPFPNCLSENEFNSPKFEFGSTIIFSPPIYFNLSAYPIYITIMFLKLLKWQYTYEN